MIDVTRSRSTIAKNIAQMPVARPVHRLLIAEGAQVDCLARLEHVDAGITGAVEDESSGIGEVTEELPPQRGLDLDQRAVAGGDGATPRPIEGHSLVRPGLDTGTRQPVVA